MLITADCAQLEWRVKAYLAQCPVAMKEIEELAWKPKEEDLHSDNARKFRLPNRTVSKAFLYRMIFADAFGPRGFGGPAYAYANDPDFMHVSSSTKFWEGVVGAFFDKYPTVYSHGVATIRTAVETGRIVNPSGRFYEFSQYSRPNGEMDWPRTNILNYPVQGLAADFMTIARKLAWERIRGAAWFNPETILFMSTVHDSVEFDVINDPDTIWLVGELLQTCFTDIPEEFERQYGVVVNVSQSSEVKVGMTMAKDKMIVLQEYLDNPSKIMV